MIPIKLAMRNFMCYRDNVPPLDFGGINTACISGDNGNGKSALIDAMTWALWGKTRAKSDDDLISLGQNEMEVVFDFAVGKQVYRIIRKRSKPRGAGRSGQTILEFQLATGGSPPLLATGGGMRSITGDTISQTQQKIIDTLHMDYITFINSALLLQGRADEFTKKQSSQRAQVLSDILGFSFYDELAEEAKDLAKAAGIEKNQLESAIRDISEELAGRAECESALVGIQKELSYVGKAVEEQEKRLSELRREKESLEDKEKGSEALEEEMSNREKSLKRWESQLAQHRSRLREYDNLIARRMEIEGHYAEFAEAKKQDAELSQKQRRSASLIDSRHRLEMRITQLQQELVKGHAVAESRIRELESEQKKQPELRNERQLVQRQIGELDLSEEALLRKRETRDGLKTELHDLESSMIRLGQEIKEIEEKIAMLSHDGGRCPLCESELGEDGINLVKTKYAAEKDIRTLSLETRQNEIVSRKAGLEVLEKDVARLETGLNKDRAELQGRASLIEQKIRDIEEARGRLDEAKERLSEIEERLARKDFAANEQVALSEIEGEIARLDYDSGRHQEVRERLSGLEPYAELKRRLEEAERLIGGERESIARAEEAIRDLQHSLEADNREKEALALELALLPKLRNDVAQAEMELDKLVREQKKTQEMIGALKGKLERYDELEKRRAEKQGLLAQASEQEQIYDELAQAFGKKGVQTMFIEMALPEIEIEANRLLSRMTDNRMHLKIDTQRESKKGDVLETLDINIADELGTRNYEMYSGGEAFRINFAIRIALSKLLARRAGAPLPTLIIDEGFGTQDATGIERIKEAIGSIQDDFEKILVITHIEELREAFPSRINVVKGASGSTLEMS